MNFPPSLPLTIAISLEELIQADSQIFLVDFLLKKQQEKLFVKKQNQQQEKEKEKEEENGKQKSTPLLLSSSRSKQIIIMKKEEFFLSDDENFNLSSNHQEHLQHLVWVGNLSERFATTLTIGEYCRRNNISSSSNNVVFFKIFPRLLGGVRKDRETEFSSFLTRAQRDGCEEAILRGMGIGGGGGSSSSAAAAVAANSTNLIVGGAGAGAASFDGDIAKISGLIRDNGENLKTLCLAENDIGNEAATELANGLKNGMALSHLDLSSNRMKPAGIVAITGALIVSVEGSRMAKSGHQRARSGTVSTSSRPAGLTSLNLSFNKVCNTKQLTEGALSLSMALRTHTHLRVLNLASCKLLEKGTTALAQALGSCVMLTELDLSRNNIGEAGALQLATSSCLGSLSLLEKLALDANNIGGRGVRALGQSLRSATLQKLTLSSNALTTGDVIAAAKSLQHEEGGEQGVGRAIREIHLSNNNLSSDGGEGNEQQQQQQQQQQKIGVTPLVELLSHALLRGFSNLTTLRLDGNKIGDEGATAMALALRNGDGTNLTCLDLRKNEISSVGVVVLSSALEQVLPPLVSLDLSDNPIDSRDSSSKGLFSFATSAGTSAPVSSSSSSSSSVAAAAASSLSSSPSSGPSDGVCASAIALGCALRTISTIQTLSLRHRAVNLEPLRDPSSTTFLMPQSGIGVNEMAVFRCFLEVPTGPKLSQIDLSNNPLGNAGVAQLAEGLAAKSAVCGSLRRLALSACGITADGISILVSRLLRATQLMTLNLSENELHSAGVCEVSRLLLASSSLVKLDLSRVAMGKRGAEAFCRSLGETISPLQFVSIAENPGSDLTAATTIGDILAKGGCSKLQFLVMNGELPIHLLRPNGPAMVSLACCGLKKEEAHIMAAILPFATTLEQLDVSDNSLGKTGLQLMRKAMGPTKRLVATNCTGLARLFNWQSAARRHRKSDAFLMPDLMAAATAAAAVNSSNSDSAQEEEQQNQQNQQQLSTSMKIDEEDGSGDGTPLPRIRSISDPPAVAVAPAVKLPLDGSTSSPATLEKLKTRQKFLSFGGCQSPRFSGINNGTESGDSDPVFPSNKALDDQAVVIANRFALQRRTSEQQLLGVLLLQQQQRMAGGSAGNLLQGLSSTATPPPSLDDDVLPRARRSATISVESVRETLTRVGSFRAGSAPTENHHQAPPSLVLDTIPAQEGAAALLVGLDASAAQDPLFRFLSSLGLEEYFPKFVAEDVGLSELMNITDDELKELGVNKLGHRKRIKTAIAGSGVTTPTMMTPLWRASSTLTTPTPTSLSIPMWGWQQQQQQTPTGPTPPPAASRSSSSKLSEGERLTEEAEEDNDDDDEFKGLGDPAIALGNDLPLRRTTSASAAPQCNHEDNNNLVGIARIPSSMSEPGWIGAERGRALSAIDEFFFSNYSRGMINRTVSVESTESTSSSSSSVKKHIMLSYQWEHQKLVLAIAKELRERNYDVWMDVTHMKGDVLEAMAKAVDDSAVVCVCSSSKYAQSVNCKRELEYALMKKKDIVPLIMESGYTRPSGWLGIALGSRLYFDFSKPATAIVGSPGFLAKIEELEKELGERGKVEKGEEEGGGGGGNL